MLPLDDAGRPADVPEREMAGAGGNLKPDMLRSLIVISD
jgi:hypothetical protein